MDWLTSPWFICAVIMIFLIGNVLAFRYSNPSQYLNKNKRQAQRQRLIELDEKHQQWRDSAATSKSDQALETDDSTSQNKKNAE